jgi:inosine-uridine nucleoside N-ribohydrolase
LLKSPELDLKLVVTDFGKVNYRPRVVAKFLERAGRTDVAVGVGLDVGGRGDGAQAQWVKGYNLQTYPGKVYSDGVQALIDFIMRAELPVTLIAIGPAPNLGEALRREPRIAERARFVGMYGSVRIGYDGSQTPAAEWNVKADPKACRQVFTAPWEMLITPLDTCGLVVLKGERYAQVRDSQDPVARLVIENYRTWLASQNQSDASGADKQSSTLFDCVAVYLACSQEFCQLEKIGLRITDDGFTRIDEAAKVVTAATAWKDRGAFEDFLVRRLTGGR